MGDVVLGADFFKPFGASASGGNNRLLCENFVRIVLAGYVNALAGVSVENNVGTFISEKNFHAVVLKPMFKGKIKLLRLFGSEMAYGTVDKLKARLNGSFSDFLDLFGVFDTLNVLVGTEFKIYLIGIINGFLGKILADKRGKVAAHLIAQ